MLNVTFSQPATRANNQVARLAIELVANITLNGQSIVDVLLTKSNNNIIFHSENWQTYNLNSVGFFVGRAGESYIISSTNCPVDTNLADVICALFVAGII